jgi:hypothetical protein
MMKSDSRKASYFEEGRKQKKPYLARDMYPAAFYQEYRHEYGVLADELNPSKGTNNHFEERIKTVC